MAKSITMMSDNSLIELKQDVNKALNTLTDVERIIVRKTAMTRQQQYACDAVARELNIPLYRVQNIRKASLRKLAEYLINAKFASVTVRVFNIPELA